MSETFKSLMVAHGDVIRDLIENEGEITPEHEAILSKLMEKVDSLESFRQALDFEAQRFDSMIKMLNAAKKRAVDRLAWIDGYVITHLQASGETEVSGDITKLVLQNNPPSVVIEDQSQIPSGLMRMPAPPPPPMPEPDKKAIADKLKAGEAVPGASLRRSVRLVSKPNSILTKAKRVTA
jgi:hypothetical protein